MLKILHVYCPSDFLSAAQWQFCTASLSAVGETEPSLVKELVTFGDIFNDVL